MTDLGVALIPTELIHSATICYSVGVGEDIEFERRLVASGNAKHWLIDPTPRSVAFMRDPINRLPRTTFLPIGAWESDCVIWFNAPADDRHVSHSITEGHSGRSGFEAECRSIGSVMAMLGHHQVDLLKMNIEGAEDAVLRSMLGCGIRPTCIVVTWEGRGALKKAFAWTRLLRSEGWEFCGRKGWYFTYLRTS